MDMCPIQMQNLKVLIVSHRLYLLQIQTGPPLPLTLTMIIVYGFWRMKDLPNLDSSSPFNEYGEYLHGHEQKVFTTHIEQKYNLSEGVL